MESDNVTSEENSTVGPWDPADRAEGVKTRGEGSDKREMQSTEDIVEKLNKSMNDVEATFAQGLIHLLTKNYNAAVECLEEEFERPLVHARATIARCVALAHLGKWRQALRVASATAKLYPEFADLQLLKGCLEYFTGSIFAAVVTWKAGAADFPSHPAFRCWLATIMLQHGKPDTALSLFRGFDLDKGGDFTLFMLHAWIYFAKKDLDKCSRYLSRAVEQKPESQTAHLLTGVLHMQSGKLSDAIDSFFQVLSVDSVDDTSPTQLTSSIAGRPMSLGAMTSGSKAEREEWEMALSPLQQRALCGRAICYVLIGDAGNALRDCRRFREVCSSAPWMPNLTEDEGAKAVEARSKVMRIVSEVGKTIRSQQVTASLGQLFQSDSAAETSVEKDAEAVDILGNSSMYEAAHSPVATRSLGVFLAVARYALILQLNAELCVAAKQYDECIRLCSDFLEVHPPTRDILLLRSLCHWHSFNIDSALLDAQKACVLLPDDEGLEEYRRLLLKESVLSTGQGPPPPDADNEAEDGDEG